MQGWLLECWIYQCAARFACEFCQIDGYIPDISNVAWLSRNKNTSKDLAVPSWAYYKITNFVWYLTIKPPSVQLALTWNWAYKKNQLQSLSVSHQIWRLIFKNSLTNKTVIHNEPTTYWCFWRLYYVWVVLCLIVLSCLLIIS